MHSPEECCGVPPIVANRLPKERVKGTCLVTAFAAALFLAIGLPCLVLPRAMQRLASHIYRFDGDRRRDFIASGGYLVMLRLLGALWTCVGLFLVAVLVIPGFAIRQ